MAFPESILDDDEQVVRNLRPHWRRVVVPVALVPIVVGLASYGWFALPSNGARHWLRDLILIAAIVVLIWWSVRPLLRWVTTRYVVTNRRVLMRNGVFSRTGRDVPLTRINDVSFGRTVVERIIGSGTLTIESAGDRGQVILRDVPHVEECQRDIYRLVENEAQRLR
ncbi:MAG TPA: PH domain-containing protein [Mycobacteriales bacterium]|nr:PH domain-containing protein [Mycobacteriales bacterium]